MEFVMSNSNNRNFRKQKRIRGCLDKEFDYKDIDTLRRYVNEYGRIRPRRQTSLCAKSQRNLAKAVKRARHLALLPFVAD
jgi:small subunit ribosomal protein S18